MIPTGKLSCKEIRVHEPFQYGRAHSLRAETRVGSGDEDRVGGADALTVGSSHVRTRKVDVKLPFQLRRTSHSEVRVIRTAWNDEFDVPSAIGRPMVRIAHVRSLDATCVHFPSLERLYKKKTTCVSVRVLYQTKGMPSIENPQVVLMTAVGTSIQHLDALTVRFRRTDTNAVLRAYRTIVSCEEADTGYPASPRCHVFWIFHLAHGSGMMIVPRAEVKRLRNLINIGCTADWTGDEIPVSSFDPNAHALLCTDFSVASYMDQNPDNILGADAHVESPTFKHALVWWESCA